MVYEPHRNGTTTQKDKLITLCESSFTSECVPLYTNAMKNRKTMKIT